MKRISSFRLFESGERLESRIKEIRDIYEDAKSIEYILEDGGYDFNWKIDTQYQSYPIEGDISDLIRSNSFTSGVFHHDFINQVNLKINITSKDGKYFGDYYDISSNMDEVRRFKTLLEDHLDYLPEGSISIDYSRYSLSVIIKLKRSYEEDKDI